MHYQNDHRRDPESLARHADFLTQWSQILRPRGQIKESIMRLDAALNKAKAATSQKNFPLEAARARVSAGRRLGEALIEDEDFQRARSALTETITFSAALPKYHGSDIRTGILIAELHQEMAILEFAENHLPEAQKAAKKSQQLWGKSSLRSRKTPTLHIFKPP